MKAVLAGGGLLLALLVGEVAVRVLGVGALRPDFQFDVRTLAGLDEGSLVRDRDLFWREPGGRKSAQHQRGHFIQVDDPVPAKDGRLRVICLGDSCTRLSQRSFPYPTLLEAALGSQRADVHNASLPGYTSHQGLAWLKRQLLAWQPDLLVVYFGWNDHWRSTGIADKDYAAAQAWWRPRLLELFRGRPAVPPLRVEPADYLANLRGIASLVSRGGGQTVFVIAPQAINAENTGYFLKNGAIVPGDDPLALHRQYLAQVRTLSGEPGVILLDAEAQFAAIDEPRWLLQRDGIHPTDPGHAVLARTLAEMVQRRFLGSTQPAPDPVVLGAGVLGQSLSAEGQWAPALRAFGKAVAADPRQEGPRLGLAWLLATCPQDSLRDGTRALELLGGPDGQHGPDGPAPASFQYFDVLAAAQAEAGRFAEAVASADRALALLGQQGHGEGDFARSLQVRREGYLAGRPYRLPAPAGSPGS